MRLLLDASELYRPEPIHREIQCFRKYTHDNGDPIQARVIKTYHDMHTNMTVDFVKDKRNKWMKFNTVKGTVMEMLEKLNDLVDESDPDLDLPNIVHAFQTAERIREAHPELDWYHLTGLIHDLGKVLALYDEPQWAVVGDTFVVGCEYARSIVYRDTSFIDNPDGADPRYNTYYGQYEKNCGLDNVLMSWGHDEYLYQVLKHNKAKLPEEALYIIRYHSFYPWHSGGDYMQLCDDKDMKMLSWVKNFNKFDLYTKSTKIPDIEALTPYYESLVEKYIPGVLEW